MNQKTLNPGRMALNAVAAATILLLSLDASALGLGRVAVQSTIGETLRAEIEVTSITPEEASNLRVIVAKPDAYRAAGVDYNAVLPSTRVSLQRKQDGRNVLKITSDRAVQEPFVDVILELSWSTGRLVREFTMLFDPPSVRVAAPPEVAADPVMSAAPPAAAPAPTRRPPAVKPQERPAPAPVAQSDVPDAGPGGEQYAVRPGDTLSRIAGRLAKPGVSLDQMLVSLYRGNPQAFVDNNMNRLRSGVVLKVPGADAATSVSTDDARQIIQAQSADFNAFRQRLAGAVPTAKADTSPRQAKGSVQATVEDKRPSATQAPDKLTLSAGSASGAAKSSLEEEKISKEREKKAAEARAAELSKNVEDLKQLANAASASVSTPPPSTEVSAPLAVPGVVAPPEPEVASEPVAVVSAPEVTPSEPVAAASAASAPVAEQPPVSDEPGLIDKLLGGSMGLILGGAAVALLAGFGLYRLSKRTKRDSGETSFLESRLQPDSFFGASGGQRIDTRDASGASSSMSYSLSQLDAIGDVDPVAEADVYLAYGRDLQAEEILKEAMRGNPDRLAIRTKLLEVYAKRRDTKGFEALAVQLFELTQGTGEDWAKAQEMGAQIDPDNQLYLPGGAPSAGGHSAERLESFEASTRPQSVLPAASGMGLGSAEPPPSQDPDLDLELDLSATPRSPSPITEPGALDETPKAGFDFNTDVKRAPAADSAPSPLDFDLGAISLDLDGATGGAEAAEVSGTTEDAGDDDDGRDPLERKLDLAEEFRQIGDVEGARDLLQEVVNKATGSLRSKAQTMLDSLS